VEINVKTGMPPFGILANHKIKMCHNSMKNNDTKDYSEQLEFLSSQPYYASKKIVIQSSDFPVRHTGLYRHKKSTGRTPQ